MFCVRCRQSIGVNEPFRTQLIERQSGPMFVTYRHEVCLVDTQTGIETVRLSRIPGWLRLPTAA